MQGQFYQTTDVVSRPLRHNSIPLLSDIIYVDQFFLKPEVISHNREIYHMLDLLGDIGGVSSIFIMIVGFLI